MPGTVLDTKKTTANKTSEVLSTYTCELSSGYLQLHIDGFPYTFLQQPV